MTNFVNFYMNRSFSTSCIERYKNLEDVTIHNLVIARRRVGLAANWPAPLFLDHPSEGTILRGRGSNRRVGTCEE